MKNATFKKVRVKKGFGVWYYRKIDKTIDQFVDEPYYELYDENKSLVFTAPYFWCIKYWIQNPEKRENSERFC